MSNTWIQWEGQIVNGKFQLLRYLGGSETGAVFLTQRQENERIVNAAIKIIPCTSESGSLQLARWKTFSELSHPNLISLYETGQSETGDVSFVYVVMECADENLSQVVPGRALAEDEAREIIGAVLRVLSYLHEKGFVHGAVGPANIMAAADQLKLSSDSLHLAGETLDDLADRDAYIAPEISNKSFPLSQPLSPASDVWSLGMTVIESLTRTLPAIRAIDRQDPFIPKTLPQPFLDIAQHCLVRNPQGRWSIDEIAARLEGRVPVPAAREVPAPAEAIPVSASEPAPAPPPVARVSRPPAKPNRYLLPFAAGFALVVAALLVGPRLLHRHPDAEAAEATSAANAQSPATPASSQPAPAPASSAASASQAVASSKPSYSDSASSAKAPAPVPALIHPETVREGATETAARVPVGPSTRGEVTHRAMPQVIQSARNSIHGTVRVGVKANVDREGNVEDAELISHGPSRYFARTAMEAARQWKFNPPTLGGRGVLSTWILQFEFTRGETTVVPKQELP
jgi:eukaryotic-like serine/threonine-protein kinase